MNEFLIHITIHLGILAAVLVLFGYVLRKWFKDNHIKPYYAFVPFYNLLLWLRSFNLPGWLVVVILQGYWYPVWWVQTTGLLLITYLVIQTRRHYHITRIPRFWYLIIALAGGAMYAFLPGFSSWIHLFFGGIGWLLLLTIRKSRQRSAHASGDLFQRLKQHMRSGKMSRIALFFLGIIVFLAVYAPYLANSLPLYANINGKVYFPVTESLQNPDARVRGTKAGLSTYDWSKVTSRIMPPIPYSPDFQDSYNRNFAGPGDEQFMSDPEHGKKPISKRYRHILGTDRIGRDIFSGLIHGSGTALTVGFVAMGIAAILGIFLGGIAGYYGNTGLKLTRFRLITGLFSVFLGYFYGFVTLDWFVTDTKESGGSPFVAIAVKWLIFLGLPALVFWIAGKFRIGGYLGKKIRFPADAVISKIIEILYSIPGILLIIVISASIPEKSLTMVMVVIGLISWTGVARLTRAEFMRIRQLDYIESAKALGYGNTRIILYHVLPNAMGPVFVAIAFGMAGAILLESSLSFLGIGVPEDAVTWGSMLKTAFVHNSSDKIWLVIAPGIAIFTVVTLYNLLGESLRDAIDPKLRK